MDTLIHRYRNLAILVVAVLAQLVLLAYQVKTDNDVRLIRVWAVTAVTPLARVLEGIRSSTFGVVRDYLVLSGAQAENRRMKEELGRLKLENQYLKSELATAQRAEALQAFQKQSQSRMVAARVIGTSTGANSRVVFVDRGSSSGVMRGMAVITPDGIVGKVVASFPTAAQVQLITDPTFAAGVMSQKSRVAGTLKGLGRSDCLVDYIQVEQPVEQGEMFFTTGDDRVFPKGLPVGVATVVRPGSTFKEIYLAPAGFQKGLDEVLIVVEGVHQQIPVYRREPEGDPKLLPPPPPETGAEAAPRVSGPATDADRLKEKYRVVGEQQNHRFGEGMVSPDFNKKPAPAAVAAPKPQPPAASSPVAAPPVTAPPVTAPPAAAPPPANP
jgi:rod shape-determining protein MreC